MKRKYRGWAVFLLLSGMLFLQGCAAGGGAAGGNGEPETASESGNQDTGMGRYMEQEITLPSEITDGSQYPEAYLQQLENGDLLLMNPAAGMYQSPDRGETWIRRETPWYEELDAYVNQIALAPNGAAALVYTSYAAEDEEADGTYEYHPEYLYADPDGNTKKLEAPGQEDIQQFWFGRDSRLYGFSLEGRAYEVDVQKGMFRQLFEIEGISEYVCFTSRYMITFTSRDEVILYDLEEEELAKTDAVLEDFVRNQVGSSFDTDTGSSRVVAAAGEQEDILYLAYSGGLYRHVIGGSVMEQLSDGSLTSLGDPTMGTCGFAVLPDNEFVVLYNLARMFRYTYDPDLPSVPKEQIHIYSLTDDYTIRQAVSLYRKQHPEIYISYEIGRTGADGRTMEDAVKNLNTKIMSGSGPDLLVLDGLPDTSYEEKGVLTDLSGIVYRMGEETHLFKNLVDACRRDGRLYALPVRFRLPLLVGDKESVDRVQDLASLADALEELRGKYPEGALIGLRTEEEVLKTLALTCSAAWTDPESGRLDEEKLADFLECARRIYQTEIAGLDEQELADYRENYHEGWQSDVASEGMYYAVASANAVDVGMETQRVGAGYTYRMDCEFNTVAALAAQNEDFGYAMWQGQIPNGFIPRCRVGIVSGAEEKEPVLDFFRFLYGRELQDMELPAGFPVNEDSFEQLRVNPREGDWNQAGIVLANEDGAQFALEVPWCPEDDFARLERMVRQTSMVSTGDVRSEQLVCELGPKALNGSAGVEDTVDEIVKKASIYLSE